jgi:hypothetical protein
MKIYGGLNYIVTMIAVTAVCYATPVTASAGEPYRLNESAGILSVVGSGRPPATAQHPVQARLLAERAAIVDAYGAAARLLSEAIPQAVPGQDGYSVFIRGGTIRRSDITPDGSVTVELEIPVRPELAGRVREVMQGSGLPEGRAAERAGISHEDFIARHRVQGPRVITLREWNDRYQTGAWGPTNQ